jgi:hypothetical protein
MTDYKIPPSSSVVDQQFVTVRGPDGIQTGFMYDAETKTFWRQPGSVIIPSFHGQTHVGEDPVPLATIDRKGLMDRNDKAKLDELVQMRLGVLGFQGAGFPDDGGWLQGDIILAAGTEFISLERIGNVIRFTVDSPIPLNCGCEECAQIFWIQDESDTASIRPPSCAGKLPGVNSYGELKVYLMPENTIIDPSNPLPTLNRKSSYPAFIFKRYENSTVPGYGEIHTILVRNSNLSTKVGWSMTPGATGKVENIWFMGLDDEGNQIKFEMDPDSDSDMLGMLLYKGHSLTRRMAVVTSYSSSILADNVYNCKFWNIDNEKVIGDEFTAKNVWQYNNPGNSSSALDNPQAMVLDATIDLLPIGTLVQIWEFQVGESGNTRLVRRYFNKEPKVNPYTLWSWSGAIKFGDLLIEREELHPGAASEDRAYEVDVSDIRLFERTIWGITVFEDRLILSDDGEGTGGTETEQVLRSDSISKLEISSPDLPNPNTVIRALLASTCVSGLSFIVNQWVGHSLRFTSGPLDGQTFQILQNASSSITLLGDAKAAEIGDTFDIFTEGKTGEPSGVPINNQYVADVDPSLPGLVVKSTDPEAWSERPVYIWHRVNHKNFYFKGYFGQPINSRFPPIDILLRAPVDSFDDVYMKIIRRGVYETGPFRGMNYIVVKGIHWDNIPPSGVLRTLTGVFRNETWNYYYKAAFDRWDDDAVALVGMHEPFLFDEDFVPGRADNSCGSEITSGGSGSGSEPGEFVTVPGNTTVAQLLHAEYNAACCRLEFSVNDTSAAESVQLQFKVGILDMGTPYELEVTGNPYEDFVRGMKPGEFAVSRIYTQDGFIINGTENPSSEPENFRCYWGGFLPSPINGETEKWNVLEVMYRDDQIWIWWNGLLVPPDPTESAKLPIPIPVNTPYFPVHSVTEIGKVALRLWPGASLRKAEIRDQTMGFNEFTYGQLEISS